MLLLFSSSFHLSFKYGWCRCSTCLFPFELEVPDQKPSCTHKKANICLVCKVNLNTGFFLWRRGSVFWCSLKGPFAENDNVECKKKVFQAPAECTGYKTCGFFTWNSLLLPKEEPSSKTLFCLWVSKSSVWFLFADVKENWLFIADLQLSMSNRNSLELEATSLGKKKSRTRSSKDILS